MSSTNSLQGRYRHRSQLVTWIPGLGHRDSAVDTLSPQKDSSAPSPGEISQKQVFMRLSSLPSNAFSDNHSKVIIHMQSNPAVQKTARELGLSSPQKPENETGSPHMTPSGSGTRHSRTISNPFTDQLNIRKKQTLPTEPEARGLPNFKPPTTPQAPFSATASFLGSSPTVAGLNFGTSSVPDSHSRADLPIPPPSLFSADTLNLDPEAAARLDARRATREEWIRTEAKKIVELSQSSFAAKQKYDQTRSQEDFDAWQNLAGAFEEATNGKKRQEERRNMFMPEGLRAMMTGLDSIHRDGMAGAQGGGNLFGFQMAHFERLGVEVLHIMNEQKLNKKEKSEDEETESLKEMIDMLSEGDKKSLTKRVKARLTHSSGRPDQTPL
ncbi:hypothetical protein GQ44DRAFT_703550 [Phaeosphaeriaceae sp. PMI808]|nr:hypothetical protein GQ44DRAFT_703550 [Phaeosphaeriaceae sp. PMI808]